MDFETAPGDVFAPVAVVVVVSPRNEFAPL